MNASGERRGLALRADPAYRLVEDILPVATKIALGEGAGASGGALLIELLYEAEGDGGAERFSYDRLQRLLATASGAELDALSARSGAPSSPLDVLLNSAAARDVVARETAGAVDALVRDAVWKAVARLSEPPQLPGVGAGPLPRLPGTAAAAASSLALAERLVPPLSSEEQLLLVRLPTALAGVVAPARPPSSVAGGSSGGAGGKAAASEFAVARVAAEPGVRAALAEVARRALVAEDAEARATVDSVAAVLRERLRARLRAAALPERVADALVQTPWRK